MDPCWQSDVSDFEFTVEFCRSFSSKEQGSFNFVAVILEPKKIKSVTVSIFPPFICHEVMGQDTMILVFQI